MIRIAIDGTASAGKGSIAKGLSRKLGFSYVDTGAMYRSVALLLSRQRKKGIQNPNMEDILRSLSFQFFWVEQDLRVLVNGEDVSEEIRTEEMGQGASQVSVDTRVREALSDIQKKYVQTESVVMDGRDIGTVIIPDAELKVFVDADITERAKRRYQEMKNKGIDVSLQTVVQELQERDHRDKNRKIAPLIQAEDAKLLDTTAIGIEQGIDIVFSWVEQILEKDDDV